MLHRKCLSPRPVISKLHSPGTKLRLPYCTHHHPQQPGNLCPPPPRPCKSISNYLSTSPTPTPSPLPESPLDIYKRGLVGWFVGWFVLSQPTIPQFSSSGPGIERKVADEKRAQSKDKSCDRCSILLERRRIGWVLTHWVIFFHYIPTSQLRYIIISVLVCSPRVFPPRSLPPPLDQLSGSAQHNSLSCSFLLFRAHSFIRYPYPSIHHTSTRSQPAIRRLSTSLNSQVTRRRKVEKKKKSIH